MYQVLVGDLLLGVAASEEAADEMFAAWAQRQIDEAMEADEEITRIKQAFMDRMATELAVWERDRKLVRL